jgi:hypothetical protein
MLKKYYTILSMHIPEKENFFPPILFELLKDIYMKPSPV